MKVIKGIKQNISLKDYTTFKIGGKAKYFTEVKNLKELKQVLQWAKDNHLPFFVLGNGSNILFSDQGYQGIIIKINNSTLRKNNQTSILVGAGLNLIDFLNKCVKNQWQGFEWLAGIPGTIGGSIYGNAGAFGNETKDFVKKVITVNPQNFQIKYYPLSQCKFGYRESIFKKNKQIIWEVGLKVRKGKKKNIQKRIQENWRYKIQHQIFRYPSAGSVFKNIVIKETPYQKAYNAKKQLVKIQGEEIQVKGGKISAGWFIEKCDLKGKSYGGAKISDFHANVIINFKKSKAKNVLFLINLVKKSVWKKFKIKLEEEIIIVR
ncbi:MAG: UDP-N-acetylmuramate dehydrogenase [Candidatus Paceibacterota bacterium]|jgi:UDP-N-acetylmuramate dehydrogenase